jgi:hypothetical protein
MMKTISLQDKTFLHNKHPARIPDPDYKKHLAYGVYFGTPSWLDRIRALVRFIPCLIAYSIFSIVRRENLSNHADNALPSDMSSPLARTLKQDGVTAVRLSPQDKQIINRQLSGLIEKLRKKQNVWKKEDGSLWWLLLKKGFRIAYFAHENERLRKELYVAENEAPELFNSLRQTLKREGVLDGASEYLGKPLDVQFLRLTFRDTTYDGKRPFKDLKHIAPRTSQLHVDHVWTVKCILYISEVNEKNGPFCYCIGSHKLHIGWLESQVRRANDRAKLSNNQLKWRRLFSALPAIFQKKAQFGNDLNEDSPEINQLLESERIFTSGEGDLIVFDDKGIHRGGLIDEGTRWALQIRLG